MQLINYHKQKLLIKEYMACKTHFENHIQLPNKSEMCTRLTRTHSTLICYFENLMFLIMVIIHPSDDLLQVDKLFG